MFSSIQNRFSSGEISPTLWGRTDLIQYHNGSSTMRNMFVNYRGGASSRAGTAYVGMCKQGAPNVGGTSTNNPPRDVPFQFNINQGFILEFGDQYMRIKSNGAYVTEPAITVTSVSSSGLFTTSGAHGYNVGDWIYDSGNTRFDGLTWVITSTPLSNTFTVQDLFGTNITSATASSGGTVSRIYTVVSPYAAIDLPYLKYAESADVMTLGCVNQITNAEYPLYNLIRSGATSWTFSQISFSSTIAAPTGLTSTVHSSTTASTYYAYVVTAVDNNGQESVASNVTNAFNNDIAIYAGSNSLAWNIVSGAQSYNIYKAIPSYSITVPIGVAFGYVGNSFGNTFTDTNITPDFTQVPPIHNGPFDRGAITGVSITNAGSGYSQSTVGYNITTSTGSGFVGVPIVSGGGNIIGFWVQNEGQNYQAGNTIAFTGGSSASANLIIGAQTGTYPGVVSYFQGRRFYANSLNYPDTYWASQPDNYQNMDYGIPVIDSDSLSGTPWAQQINGVQFMQPMPGGLVILTGKGAWQLNGGSSVAITPSNQNAVPQAYNGCNSIIPPLVVNYDILYVQSKGSIIRDLAYNFFTSMYTGTDITVMSNHLFNNKTVVQWAYAEEPYKLIWLVMNDGSLISLTYLKEQEVQAYARHDTNGAYVGVCSVTEPPVDAVYFITKRYIRGHWVYYSERMDNRLWENVENVFCVDAGLTNIPDSYLPATLYPSQSAVGTGVVFTASANIWTVGDIGDVIRIGGGQAVVTSYVAPNEVICTITQAITNVIPDNTNNIPIPALYGQWTETTPIQTITNLNHLEGMTVSILADGGVLPSQVVVNGTVTLPQPSTLVTIGLPFTSQLQTLFLEPPGQETIQGKRKNIYSVSARFENSRGMSIGGNQIDASTQPYGVNVTWTNMIEIKERNATINAGFAIPLYTGDYYTNIPASWDTRGQIALQQNYPLPMNVLSLVANFQVGDSHG